MTFYKVQAVIKSPQRVRKEPVTNILGNHHLRQYLVNTPLLVCPWTSYLPLIEIPKQPSIQSTKDGQNCPCYEHNVLYKRNRLCHILIANIRFT